MRFPKSAWLIGRKELKRIKQTTLRTFFKVCDHFKLESGVDYVYNAQLETVTFSNGSVVFLVDLSQKPTDPEFDRLGSYDLTGDFIDEAQEVPVKAINVLRGRFSLLEGDGWSTIPKALYTCNPAKNWIYMDFYKPHKEETIEPHKVFIPSLVTDNIKYVRKEYIENLKRSDTVTVQRLLYGNFEYDDDPAVLMDYDSICDLFTNKTEEKKFDSYVSCDVARFGSDKTVIGIWQSLQVKEIRIYKHKATTEVTQILEQIEEEYSIPRSHFVIDEDGVGGGVVDQFRGCKGFVNNASPIQRLEAKYDVSKKINYANLKTQCYFMLAQKVNNAEMGIDTIPKNIRDSVVEELEQVRQVDIDKEARIKIISKEEVKERIGRSPDLSDMLMMRMYFEINRVERKQTPKNLTIRKYDPGSGKLLK